MGKQRGSDGFGIIGVLAIVIVVAIVGAAGWYVFDKQKNKDDKAATNNTQKIKDVAETKTTTAKALACLTQDDYRYMNYNKEPDTVTFDATYDASGSTFNKYESMFFKPDSTTEDVDVSAYDDWADFATHAKDKQWKFRLSGSVFGKDAKTAASQKLANDRAERVHSQLVSRGVEESRFVIDAPRSFTDEVQDNNIPQIYRSVQILIDPTCKQ